MKNIKLLLIVLLLAGLSSSSVFVDSKRVVLARSDEEEELEEKEEELETLEQKADNYKRMIDLKQQQKMTLQNQMSMMNLQIDNYENEIELTTDEIERNKSEIELIQRGIDQKNDELEKVMEELSEMLRLFNQIDQELAMEYLSAEGDISKVLNQSEYIDQTSQKAKEVLAVVKTKRSELEKQRGEYEGKNNELKSRESDLKEKVSYLGNEKMTKELLLTKTQGEEAKYQTLLERVEKQRRELIGDIEELSAEKREELDKILAKAPKPKDGLASTKWYYSQKDSKWGYKRIGLSSSLMKDYGCAVTSLAMVFTKHDEDISPGKLSSQPIFYRDLIVWPEKWKSLELISSKAHSGVNWSTVRKEIKRGHPVIVFVRSRTGAGHYVVVHGRDKKGKYVVHDPLFGPNIFLETTEDLVGSIYDSSTTIDQMLIYKD